MNEEIMKEEMMNATLEEMLNYLMENAEAHATINKMVKFGTDYEVAVKLVYLNEIAK